MQNQESQNKKQKPKVPQLPKFNFYWVYAIILIIFITIQFMPHDMALKTTKIEFINKMLLSHDVEKVVVVNKERAEIYIKQQALKNDKYKELNNRGFLGKEVGPHYYFEIGDVNSFETDVRNNQKDFPVNEQVPIEYITQRNYLSDIVGWLLPFVLLIGLWMFIFRRMGGGAGGGGAQIFNIGKSKAQLFDKDTHVKITFKDVAGLDEAKVEVMEIVDFLKNPKKYTTLGGKIPKGALLVGPPGTGKTLLAKAVAGEAGVPFFSLSGSDFVEMFVGVGASRVRDLFRQAKEKAPCIIFIDEIDKTGIKYGINEVMNILIHITDPNTNDNFNDKFFQEVTFPLSKVLFIFSYNDQSKVDKILLDRIEQINVDSYTTFEKIQIFKNFILKEVCEEINIDMSTIDIDNLIIEYLIENFTYESGVRNLKRKIEKILLKLNLDRIYSNGLFQNNNNDKIIKITNDLINNILDKPNINIKKILQSPYVGIINGLYATDSGVGGILPILIYKNCSNIKKFKLKLTGSQKTVMKESIEYAFTLASNLVKTEYINKFLFENSDGLHIHFPDGATPKDGPSGGTAITCAIYSLFIKRPIKKNIAITGEIDLNGNVTEIGGLDAKLNGAKRAGVNIALIPQENQREFDIVVKNNPELLDKKFKVIKISTIQDALKHIF